MGHTRHRSPINACVQTLSCLTAYSLAQFQGQHGHNRHP